MRILRYKEERRREDEKKTKAVNEGKLHYLKKNRKTKVMIEETIYYFLLKNTKIISTDTIFIKENYKILKIVI